MKKLGISIQELLIVASLVFILAALPLGFPLRTPADCERRAPVECIQATIQQSGSGCECQSKNGLDEIFWGD